MVIARYSPATRPIVSVVDDDNVIVDELCAELEKHGYGVRIYDSAEEFLESFGNEHGCVVTELSLPGMNGLEFQRELLARKICVPVIFFTAHGGVAESVSALRNGAIDYIVKPFAKRRLFESVEEAVAKDSATKARIQKEQGYLHRISKLTCRERDIFDILLEGDEPPSSKRVALTLDISHRTVEHHKSRIFDKLEVHTAVELRLIYGSLRLSGEC